VAVSEALSFLLMGMEVNSDATGFNKIRRELQEGVSMISDIELFRWVIN
jgi:hypothetical protein